MLLSDQLPALGSGGQETVGLEEEVEDKDDGKRNIVVENIIGKEVENYNNELYLLVLLSGS